MAVEEERKYSRINLLSELFLKDWKNCSGTDEDACLKLPSLANSPLTEKEGVPQTRRAISPPTNGSRRLCVSWRQGEANTRRNDNNDYLINSQRQVTRVTPHERI